LETGRTQGKLKDAVADTRYLTLVVKVGPQLKGTGLSEGTSVRIEVPSPFGQTAEAYKSAMPSGSTIVAYLVDAPLTGKHEMNAAPSDPSGLQKLLQPVNPQGLLIGLAGGEGFASIQEGNESADATVEDVAPGADTVLGD
jgi:hypothetical protein